MQPETAYVCWRFSITKQSIQIILMYFAVALLGASPTAASQMQAAPTNRVQGVALLAKEMEKKWKIEGGEWKFENGALIGSGPSEIVYQEDFVPPFTLQYEIKVLKGMRPRVKYGRFKFANEGYEKTFGIYPAPKDAPLFHYELNTSYRVSISIGLDAVEFYVNGGLISKVPGVKNQPAQLRFCAGDNWPKGEVEYRNIVVTQAAKAPPPLAQHKPVRAAPTNQKQLGVKAEPANVPIIAAGEHKEWKSVLILSNDVLRVKFRYMPVFSAADPIPMALEFDNRSGDVLKVGHISPKFKSSRGESEEPSVSMPDGALALWKLTNGVTTVTGDRLIMPLTAAYVLTPNATIRVSATTGGDMSLEGGRRYSFAAVPFDFELRYPNLSAIESMKRQLREGLRVELKRNSRERQLPTVILSDGTPVVIDGTTHIEFVSWFRFLWMKEVADAMTLEDLLAGLKMQKDVRSGIVLHLRRRFPNAPEILDYYREELAKEHSVAWDHALSPEIWNEEFEKAAVARLEKGDFRPYSILERHRKEWIGKPDYVARISAALLKQFPIVTSKPEKLLNHELFAWSRAVEHVSATGDRQFIKFLAPALDDKRVIPQPKFMEIGRPFGCGSRVCDCALRAILTIMDGDWWEAFKKAGVGGWSTDRQAFAAHDRVIADTKKRLEASGRAPKESGVSSPPKYYEDVNARDRNGQTALWVAAAGHDVKKVKELIAAGADVNIPDSKGETPLVAAVDVLDKKAGAEVELVKLLLNAGADARNKNAKGETVLMRGVINHEVAVMLLKKGADINATNKAGSTALMIWLEWCLDRPPSKEDYQTLSEFLAAGADVNMKNPAGDTALSLACEYGDAEIVQKLIDKGAKVKDRNGDYALEQAATLGKVDAMRLLLKSGANANALTQQGRGQTIFMRTCQFRRLEPVALLVEFGADVNAKELQGPACETALTWAARSKNNAAVIKFLLHKGADADAQDAYGNTALIRAAAMGYNDNVQALLDGRADPNIKNKKGETAVTVAQRGKHPDTVALLQKTGVHVK